jgi:hypothetical protein
MEPERSLPHSLESVTCSYPEPEQSNTRSRFLVLDKPRYVTPSSDLSLGLPSGLFPSVFHTKIPHAPLYSPIRTTCPALPFFSIYSSELCLVSFFTFLSPYIAMSVNKHIPFPLPPILKYGLSLGVVYYY